MAVTSLTEAQGVWALKIKSISAFFFPIVACQKLGWIDANPGGNVYPTRECCRRLALFPKIIDRILLLTDQERVFFTTDSKRPVISERQTLREISFDERPDSVLANCCSWLF